MRRGELTVDPMMKLTMNAVARKKPQVSWSVIAWVIVLVVNNLGCGEFSTKGCRGDDAVFSTVDAIDLNLDIPVAVRSLSSTVACVPDSFAAIHGSDLSSLLLRYVGASENRLDNAATTVVLFRKLCARRSALAVDGNDFSFVLFDASARLRVHASRHQCFLNCLPLRWLHPDFHHVVNRSERYPIPLAESLVRPLSCSVQRDDFIAERKQLFRHRHVLLSCKDS